MKICVEPADLASQEFVNLVAAHTNFCDATAPAESCHHLALSELAGGDIMVWQAVLNGDMVGMAALKQLPGYMGEIKSMHTLEKSRGYGIGKHLMQTIIEQAEHLKFVSLWLETGTHPAFHPAQRLYRAFGFQETPPFGNYVLDPQSLFMTRELWFAENG